jgi:hypothetical protein
MDSTANMVLPTIPERAPTDATEHLQKNIRGCPAVFQADWIPDHDGSAIFARACVEPGAVRPLFPADFAGTGEELGFLNGGVLAGVRQVLAPSTRLYTLDLLLVSNIRDLEQSDYSGAEEILGARPFPAATAPDKTAVLELLASGPQALDWTAARQRWALEQVRLSMSGRSIATVTTEGQRRPADVALARVVDSSGKILARGMLVIDGHGRVAAKLDALCRFCQETGLPYDVLAFTTLPAQEQILVLDHLGAAVRAARAALNETDTASGTVDFTVRHKGRDREVSIPARLALEAVNSWTTTASVVVAGYQEQERADFSASITRRYESIHNDATSLPGGTGAARLAEQAVDQLADAGVLDAVPGYGRTIARYLKLPSGRPAGLELEYLALLAVWAFSRRTAAAQRVYEALGLNGGAGSPQVHNRGEVVAHLVRRCLPRAKAEYHAAAAQSLLVGSNSLPTEPVQRSFHEVIDDITGNPTPRLRTAALAEARVRTLIAATASGILQAAYGSQASTRPRGQASAFVNRMLTDGATPRAAWGRRQAEAIVATYWQSQGAVIPPQVVQDSPPPNGTRYEPVTKNGEPVPATDKWLRHAWHNRRPEKIITNDQHETNVSEQLTLADTALTAYALHLGPTGTVTQQWLDGTRNQLFDLTGTVSRLRAT